MTRRATWRATPLAGVVCLVSAGVVTQAAATTERVSSPFVMTLDDTPETALRLHWPDLQGHPDPRLARNASDADHDALASDELEPFTDAANPNRSLAPTSPAALRLGWSVTDDFRLGATGRKRAMDPELHYFALSAEAQLTNFENAGLFIGYDVYRDWLPDELPETDLAREGVFVEFRMSF